MGREVVHHNSGVCLWKLHELHRLLGFADNAGSHATHSGIQVIVARDAAHGLRHDHQGITPPVIAQLLCAEASKQRNRQAVGHVLRGGCVQIAVIVNLREPNRAMQCRVRVSNAAAAGAQQSQRDRTLDRSAWRSRMRLCTRWIAALTDAEPVRFTASAAVNNSWMLRGTRPSSEPMSQ